MIFHLVALFFLVWLVCFVITLVSEITGRIKAKKRKSYFDPMLLQFMLNQQQQMQQQMDQQMQQQMDQQMQDFNNQTNFMNPF